MTAEAGGTARSRGKPPPRVLHALYRRQILALKHFFAGRRCTVIVLDDLTSHADDLQLHSIAHGVVLLEQLAIEYGAERRRLRVVKMRGMAWFKSG